MTLSTGPKNNRRRKRQGSHSVHRWICLMLAVVTGKISTIAFAPTSNSIHNYNCQTNGVCSTAKLSSSPAILFAKNDDEDNKNEWTPNNFLESIKNLFGNNSSAQNPTSEFVRSSNPLEADDDDDDDDELPAGTSLLLKIPAKQMKPGGLRLFLMFYLMGMQNTPDPNTWRADQKLMSCNMGLEDDEPKTYVLEMLYDRDRTGMLQIELLPHRPSKQAEIRIYRCGSSPSTSYLMQESLIIDGVLDELQNLSVGTTTQDGEPNIEEEDRLLIPDPETAIETARGSLAFG